MGGFGSGRYGGRPTVESGLTLDINELLRNRIIVPGSQVFGSLRWSKSRTNEEIASLSYEARLVDPEDAWVRLSYSVNGVLQDYRVELATTPCHYGGRRWWWLCRLSGRRVTKLHLPPGRTLFAARQEYRLAYRSQRGTPLDRSHNRLRRLHYRLGADYEYFEHVRLPRPKGMHCATYKRLTAELYDAMALHNDLFALAAVPILARLQRADARRRRNR